MGTYRLNQTERVTVTFGDDPTSPPTITVTSPSGTATVYTYPTSSELVRESTRVFHVDITFTSVGTWTAVGDVAGMVNMQVTRTLAVEAVSTAADWIRETAQHLYAGSPEKINRLDAGIDATSNMLTVTYDLEAIGPGSTLSVDAEVMYVWDVVPLSKVATVERAYAGSTRAAHAAGALIGVNPNFTGFAILRALNQELESLASAGLYAMVTTELTWNPTTAGYDLAGVSNLDTIYEVQWRRSGLTADWRPVGHYRLLRNANVTDFPSGNGLFVDSGESGQPLQVLYKTRFSALADFNGDVADTDLPSSAWDIPPLGAAARLVAPREVGRNDTSTQGDTRRSTEVPAGAVARSASVLLQLRGQRISEERAALSRKYPVRSTV